MGFLSREIVRRAMPLVVAGAAGAAGAVLAQRRLGERRRLSLAAGPPARQPGPVPPDPAPPSPGPPEPGPPPAPSPTPEPPSPGPDPVPPPTIETPQPGVAVVGELSQGPEAAGDVIEPPPGEADLEQAVRSALLEAAPDGTGAVDVEVAGGMVVLRGQVDRGETIRELERAAAGVRGVEGVRVLLHLPGRAGRRST